MRSFGLDVFCAFAFDSGFGSWMKRALVGLWVSEGENNGWVIRFGDGVVDGCERGGRDGKRMWNARREEETD